MASVPSRAHVTLTSSLLQLLTGLPAFLPAPLQSILDFRDQRESPLKPKSDPGFANPPAALRLKVKVLTVAFACSYEPLDL